ncbi:hypothetical protein [Burkholderia anthina]|uniref:hypothetical protein n=1 Tax=Burkholderia anthina TaxID=179879 RepID=UPI00158B2D87|nr:hypothetical protein [Burkholderia anthina]
MSHPMVIQAGGTQPRSAGALMADVANLESLLSNAKARHRYMREVNALLRVDDRRRLALLGVSDRGVEAMMCPDPNGEIGYTRSELAANARAIRMLRRRIACYGRQQVAAAGRSAISR